MIQRFVILLLSLVILDQTALLARAEGADEVHLRKGVSLLIANQNAEALEQFKKAYEIVPSPRAAAQVGLAERALGRWAESEQHLKEALAATEDSWITRNRQYIEAQLGHVSQQLGTLIVAGPPGATILVDGAPQGQLPQAAELRLVPGTHRVEATLPGFEPFTGRSTIRAGHKEEMTVELSRLPARAPSPPPVETAASPEPVATPSSAADLRPPKTQTNYESWNAVLGWSALVGGIAGSTAGVVMLERIRDGNPLCNEGISDRCTSTALRTLGSLGATSAFGGLILSAVSLAVTPRTRRFPTYYRAWNSAAAGLSAAGMLSVGYVLAARNGGDNQTYKMAGLFTMIGSVVSVGGLIGSWLFSDSAPSGVVIGAVPGRILVSGTF